MAYLLPNLPPAVLRQSNKAAQTCLLSPLPQPKPTLTAHTLSPLATLQASPPPPPPPPPLPITQSPTSQNNKKHDANNNFYANLGVAVRTLREDLPALFSRDLNYNIYRDDITFIDPLNTFSGIENYKSIFWALRFHGRVLFREISLEVLRIWQVSENNILIRWELRGVPRVPWEAEGQFQGTSWYKLDRNGKIYEHKVDNLAFNFPHPMKPAASVLDLVAGCSTTPNPTFMWLSSPADADANAHSSSWLSFYRAVRETLDHQAYYFLVQDRILVTATS
ncbi:uncharacterized protein LOC131144319 [Malania oleifera]|uniref:uncharacterized protein LOC131144319 n=1 Tax=Malania oleifera TaxID=397392 RepID=UPI0025ADA3B9|nr:uncharacterized protein LOC131144319 [Malania oleifera]